MYLLILLYYTLKFYLLSFAERSLENQCQQITFKIGKCKHFVPTTFLQTLLFTQFLKIIFSSFSGLTICCLRRAPRALTALVFDFHNFTYTNQTPTQRLQDTLAKKPHFGQQFIVVERHIKLLLLVNLAKKKKHPDLLTFTERMKMLFTGLDFNRQNNRVSSCTAQSLHYRI